MKKIMTLIAKGLGMVVMAGVFLFGNFLTFHVSTVIFPGRWIEPALSLLLFDAGFAWWVASFVYVSKGIPQRALSLVMIIFSFIGMSLTSMGDILMGGQQLTQVNQILGFDLGAIMVVVYIVAAIVNIAAGALHFISSPEILAQIWHEVQDDESRELAQHEAQAQRQAADRRLAPAVGAMMHRQMRQGHQPDVSGNYREAWKEEEDSRIPVPTNGGNPNGHGGNGPKSPRLP